MNGMGSGKGTHVSVYVYIMRGENDHKLVWPFYGVVQVHLLNQLADEQHHEQAIDFTSSSNLSVSSRVMVGERSARGQGFAQFVSHLDLKLDVSRNRQYLKGDVLRLRVAHVEVLGGGKKSGLKKLFKK